MNDLRPPSIPVWLGQELTVEGTSPVVLISANGAGKTRFGTFLVQRCGYDRVPALRGLMLQQIPMWPLENARTNSESALNQFRQDPTQIANDLEHMMGELKAEDADAATLYRKRAIETQGNAGIPDQTRLDVLARLWGLVFPGRELDLTSYNPSAKWKDPSRPTAPYPTSAMSDGERSALYLISRILKAKPGVVIVDGGALPYTARPPVLGRC